MKQSRRAKCLLAGAVVMVSAGAGSAATVHVWTGPGGTTLVPVGGNWNDPSHWSDGQVPPSAEGTALSFGGNGAGAVAYTAHNDIPGTFTLGRLYLDSSASGGTHHLTGNPLRLVPVPSPHAVPQPVIQNLRGTWEVANDLELVGDVRTGQTSGGVTLSGVISGSGSLTGSGLTLTGANTLIGALIAGSRMTITGGGRTGFGPVEVPANGRLQLDSAHNVRSDGQVHVLAGGAVQFDTLDNAAIDRIDPRSAGMVGVAGNVAADLDLTGLANVWIGTIHTPQFATPGPVYTLYGAITPAEQTWRFGGTHLNDNLEVTRPEQSTLKVASPLHDDGSAPRSVRIGLGGSPFSPMRVALANVANSYSGGTVVEPRGALAFDFTPAAGETPVGSGPVEVRGTLLLSGPAGGIGSMSNAITFIGGSLIFDNQTEEAYAQSQHWPDARPIALEGALLRQRGNATAALSEKIGALSVAGGNNLLLLDAAAPVGSTDFAGNELHFDSLARLGRATVQMHAMEAGSLGTINRFKIGDTTGLVSHGMLAPWVVGVGGSSTLNTAGEFLRVDDAGVVQTAVYFNGTDAARDDEVADVFPGYGGTFSGGEVWALRVRDTASYAATPMIVRGGGVILHAGSFAEGGGLHFEDNGTPIEGIIYTSGDCFISGTIHTMAGLTKFGPGVLDLYGNNTFTGGLTINGGTVRPQNAGAFNASAPNAMTLHRGGTLDLYARSVTVSGLAGEGTVINTQGGTQSIYTLTVDTATDQTFAGVLRNQFGRGQLGLTKTGPAALTLTGTYGYVGPTTVSEGVLHADFAVSEAWAQNRDFIVAAGATLSIGGQLFAGNIDGEGTVTVGLGGLATARRVRQDTLTVNGTGSLTLMEGIPTRPAEVSRVRALSVTSTGRLDLNNNSLIVDYDAGGESPFDAVDAAVALGRAGGAWDGPGISSGSAGKAGGLRALGVAEASDILGLSGTETGAFLGQSVDGSALLVTYTLAGDANLDGLINIDDYGRIDGNIAQSGSVFGWFNGDFNYDGSINIDDYGIIDGNIGAGGVTAAGGGAVVADFGELPSGLSLRVEDSRAVPEPAGVGWMLGALGMLMRRRRGSLEVAGLTRAGQRVA